MPNFLTKNLLLAITVFMTVAFANSASAAKNTTLDFDGASDYVVVADSAVLDQANSLSLSVWIEPDDAPAADEYILYRYNNYYLKINSSRKIVGGLNDATERVTSVKTITADGAAWTHIELTYNKDATGVDEIKLYINGVLDAVGDYSTAITASDRKLYIGAGDTGNDNIPENWFDGQIDNPALYQYARSAADVRLDYNNGLAVHFGPTLKDCSTDPASCMDYGLVGNWSFDEGSGQGAYDASGNSNNGRLGSSSTADSADPLWTKGKNGGGLKFDGVNDYVNAGNAASLNITDAITVEAWVKPFNNDTGIVFKVQNLGGDARGGYSLLISPTNKFRFNVGKAAYYDTADSGVVSLGQWYHVVGTHNGTNLIVYVNGVAGTPIAATLVPWNPSTADMKIGYYWSGNNYINGSIDEVRIYNRALTAEEIRYHYNRGWPVAEWKFDEGSGTKAYDSTENNNDGTLIGATHLPTWVEGKYGSAISFDGVDDYVDAGNGASLNITGAITIEAWVYWTTGSNTNQFVIYKFNSGDANDRIYWYITKSTGLFHCGTYTGAVFQEVSTTLSANTWYHIVWTYNKDAGSNQMKLYANSILKSQNTYTRQIPTTTGNWLIGGQSGSLFSGTIDDVRIYNYARTAEQILVDYNNGMAAHLK